MAIRRQVHSEHFSGERFLKRHEKKIRNLLTKLCAFAMRRGMSIDLLLRIYLNWAFPVGFRHLPAQQIAIAWDRFLEEWLTADRTDLLCAVKEPDESVGEALLKAWTMLPDDKFRRWWQSKCAAVRAPSFPRPHYYSREYIDFLAAARLLDERTWYFGLWGTPEMICNKIACAQAGALARIASSISISYLLTEKGQIRQRTFFEQQYGRSSRSPARDENVARDVARTEWCLDMDKERWPVAPGVSGLDSDSATEVEIVVFSD